jgi:hypothetical protein
MRDAPDRIITDAPSAQLPDLPFNELRRFRECLYTSLCCRDPT